MSGDSLPHIALRHNMACCPHVMNFNDEGAASEYVCSQGLQEYCRGPQQLLVPWSHVPILVSDTSNIPQHDNQNEVVGFRSPVVSGLSNPKALQYEVFGPVDVQGTHNKDPQCI